MTGSLDRAASQARLWLAGVLPLAALGVLLWISLTHGPVGVFRADLPPVEQLDFQRIVLKDEPKEIVVHVINSGPDEVTIAQVLVDQAYWTHLMEPGRILGRLVRAKVTIPYPWVQGDSHEVTLLTSQGTTFSKRIDVATETPEPTVRYFTTFTLLGIYARVIPVFLGLLWLPFVRQLNRQWVMFVLALTEGFLVFLGTDALAEAMTLATERVPGPFQGLSLVLMGAVGSFLVLMTIGSRGAGERRDAESARMALAYFIAFGIGLHNLGEGLAIGVAYALGNVTLGSLLVVGFTMHNTTEGLAIVAPVSRDRPQLYHFILLGILAGSPTILGAWIGGFTFLPELSTLFLSLGAGAIFLVVYEVGKLILREQDGQIGGWPLVAGFLCGLVIMYLTGILVAL